MSRRTAPQVVVVGGGPVGLAAAIACVRAGRQTVVLEQGRGLLDKACGEGLMPDALAALEQLGVPLPSGRAIEGIRYVDERRSVRGRFPGAPGRGVRRIRLHQALRDAALREGVELREGRRVEGLAAAGAGFAVCCEGERLMPELVVAADGLRSRLRQSAGLARDSSAALGRRFGVRVHFAVAALADEVEVHWSENVEAYVTPVGHEGGVEEVGVALLWREPFAGPRSSRDHGAHNVDPQNCGVAGDELHLEGQREKPSFEALLRRFPSLFDRFATAERTSAVRGIGPLRQRASKVVNKNLVLIGDAAGYIDAITGEGMAIGLREAVALGRSLARHASAKEALAEHAVASARLRRLPETITRLALVLSTRPVLRRRFLAALERSPKLFDALLALHVGADSRRVAPLEVGSRLLWGLLGAGAR